MLDLRVATAPCLLGYGEVGLRLADPKNSQVDRSKDNVYYEWALNYAKDDFQSAVVAGRNLLEQSVANEPISQNRLNELSRECYNATRVRQRGDSLPQAFLRRLPNLRLHSGMQHWLLVSQTAHRSIFSII